MRPAPEDLRPLPDRIRAGLAGNPPPRVGLCGRLLCYCRVGAYLHQSPEAAFPTGQLVAFLRL
jgi:hypothetical protein